MGRDRLFSLSLPAPQQGAAHDIQTRAIPNTGAHKLENIRVDGGIARSRDGTVQATVIPALDSQGSQTGTAAFTQGLVDVVGTGTLFLSEFAVGDYIKRLADGHDTFTKIDSITDNLNIVLVTGGYRGTTGSGAAPTLATLSPDMVTNIFDRNLPDETIEIIYAKRTLLYRFTNSAWVPITGAPNVWTGSDRARFFCVSAPFTTTTLGRLIISNGVDEIRAWAGTTTAMTQYLDSSVSPNIDSARFAVVGDDNRLFLGYITESGTVRQQRVRWSVIALVNGNATDFSDVVGGAGALDLRNNPYPITGMWKQLGRIYVGKNKAIEVLLPTGVASDAYPVETLQTQGEGLFFPQSLIQFGNFVGFITYRDFVLFDGANITGIGGAMRRALFKRLNLGSTHSITSRFDPVLNRVGWGLPLDGADTPTEIWWYSIDTRSWEVDPFPHTAFSGFTNLDITTVDELTGAIDDLDTSGGAVARTVDELSGSTGEERLIIGRLDGSALLFDPTAKDDDGVAFTGVYESGSIPLIGRNVRIAGRDRAISKDDHLVFDSIDISLLDRGDTYSLDIEVSGDGGANFTNVGSVTLTTASVESDERVIDASAFKRISLKDSVMIRIKNITGSGLWGWTEATVWVDIVGRKR